MQSFTKNLLKKSGFQPVKSKGRVTMYSNGKGQYITVKELLRKFKNHNGTFKYLKDIPTVTRSTAQKHFKKMLEN